MPIYVYEVVRTELSTAHESPGCESAPETFEVVQSLSEPPLTRHPTTGEPVRRVLTAPAIAGRFSPLTAKAAMSEKNLEAKGFTKYVKMGDGVYEKRTGEGPRVISRDS